MAKPRKEIDIAKAERLAALGLTAEQIAHNLGVGRSTLFEHMQDNPDLADSIKRGAAAGIEQVANKLFEESTDL